MSSTHEYKVLIFSLKYVRPEDVPSKTFLSLQQMVWKMQAEDILLTRLKTMIKNRQKCFGWEFLFLGANIEAVETAGRIGIKPDRAVDYKCDSEGTALNYEVLGETVSAFRSRSSAAFDAG